MVSTLDPANLAAVVKAYDVRGTVGDQLDDDLARAVGHAFVTLLGGEAGSGPAGAPARSSARPVERVVVGRDMRPSSPGLAAAFAEGVASAGADVVMIGLASTDQLYFASGRLDAPAAMVTASHNPAGYNGIKLCRARAVPVGRDTGLSQIRDLVGRGGGRVAATMGSVRSEDLLDAYAAHLLDLAPVLGRPLRVVVDAGNGMAGHTAPAVLGRLDRVEVVPLYFELDGTFPHHEANPIEPENLRDLQAAVVAEGADVGLAFDGDADRCFLVDERGRAVSPSTLTGLIAARELAKHPGSSIIHNLITSRAVPELVAELGGTAIRTRVGHSFIKTTMAQTGAVFGGEHSGHFYFRDFWRADSGMLAALHVLGALAAAEQPLSELLAPYERYPLSGEINSTVGDAAAVTRRIEREWASRPGVSTDHLDGLSVSHPDWSFNVRASNTEPLLRLNAEGKDDSTMERVRDEVLAMIRSER